LKIISLVNKKGGCGKSSLVCLLALHWGEREGKRVAITDQDSQGSSEAFVRYMASPNISLYEEGGEYDYVLIDTPGGISSRELTSIVGLSDLVIIPMSLSPTDIRSSAETAGLVNAPKKTRLLFNRVNTRTLAFAGRGEVSKAIGLKPLKSHLGSRVAYSYALVEGLRALNRKSIAELAQLAEEIG
jgi:chromosome partitioning protein